MITLIVSDQETALQRSDFRPIAPTPSQIPDLLFVTHRRSAKSATGPEARPPIPTADEDRKTSLLRTYPGRARPSLEAEPRAFEASLEPKTRSVDRIHSLFTMINTWRQPSGDTGLVFEPNTRPDKPVRRIHFLRTSGSASGRSPAGFRSLLPGGARPVCLRAAWPSGGARRDRTDDLMLAKHALSQLSYGPLLRSLTRRRRHPSAWLSRHQARRPFGLAVPAASSRPEQRDEAALKMVGLGRLELPTSRLSSARSNQLSYKPEHMRPGPHRRPTQTQATRPYGRKRNEDGDVPPNGSLIKDP